MPRIAIVGPSRLFREALSRMLAECGYHVVAHAIDPAMHDGAAARRDDVDLVLTELPSPDRSMADWLERVVARFPHARIIILTEGRDDPQALLDALVHGAHGCIQKNLSFETVRAVVDAVWHDQMVYPTELRSCLPGNRPGPVSRSDAQLKYFNPAVRHARRLPEPTAAAVRAEPGPNAASDPSRVTARSSPGLSSRENQILQELAQGHANKLIAFHLNLSEATVKSHLKSLLRKLGFRNRTQAAIWALTQHETTNDGRATGTRP